MGGKRRLIRGTGSTTRVSNGTRPQDPGGGEVQLAAFRDMAVARPILQPTSQPTSVMVVTEELQHDMRTGLESGPSVRGRDEIGVSGTFHLVGAPTDVLRYVAEEFADFAWGGAVVVAADVAALTDVGKVTVGVAGLADAGMVFPADFAGVVAADVAALVDAGKATIRVAVLADAGMVFPADFAGVVAADATALADVWMVTVGVTDLADPGMAFPGDLAGVVATLATAGVVTVGVVSLADAGVGTIGVSALADAGMVLPADLAGVATLGVASFADAEMTFPADPAGAVTVGVAGRTDVVDVLKCGGGDIDWNDRMLPGNGHQTWTPSQQDVDR